MLGVWVLLWLCWGGGAFKREALRQLGVYPWEVLWVDCALVLRVTPCYPTPIPANAFGYNVAEWLSLKPGKAPMQPPCIPLNLQTMRSISLFSL